MLIFDEINYKKGRVLTRPFLHLETPNELAFPVWLYRIKLFKHFQLHSTVIGAACFGLIGVDRLG